MGSVPPACPRHGHSMTEPWSGEYPPCNREPAWSHASATVYVDPNGIGHGQGAALNSNRDMIKSISLRTGLPRAIVKDVMEAFEDYVRDEIVENGEVYVPKVFTAVSHEVKPRKVLDPRTMTWRDFPASYRLTLRASARIRTAYKEAFNNFDEDE